MRIVILDGYTENPGDLSWEGLAALGELTVYDRTPPEEILPRMRGAQAVFVNKTPLLAEAIAGCPELKYIGVLATGYNVVDLKAAEAAGVCVSNIPGYGTRAVAQHTIALLLEICSRVGLHDRSVHAGDWTGCPDFCYWLSPLRELAGKTFGVVGYGRIGRAAAEIARALGMEILAASRREIREQGVRFLPLPELFAAADVVSLHCPLFPETKELIRRENILRMKDGAILLNTARGGLVNEADLAWALNSGKLAAAGLDVVSEEPIRPDNPLLGAKNCVLTPHVAWASRESRQRLMDIAVENLRSYLAGRPTNLVSAPVATDK